MENSEIDSDLSSSIESCPSETEFAGVSKVCEGCPGQSLCKKMHGMKDPDQEMIDLRMGAIKHKILVISGKGGVGKSSTAAEIAIALSERGKKVGLLDVDVCGPSIPRLLDVEDKDILNESYGWIPVRLIHRPENHNVVVMSVGFMLKKGVIWRGPRKTNLIKRFLKDTYWGKLDFLIVDTPPGTSDEHLSIVSSLKKAKPDGAVIVTTPQEVSLTTIRKEINFCEKMKLPILGIIENMSGFVCPCCGEQTDIFMNGGGEKLAKEYNINFLGKIPLDPVHNFYLHSDSQNITSCLDAGKCVFCNFKDSPAVQAISKVVDKLVELTGADKDEL